MAGWTCLRVNKKSLAVDKSDIKMCRLQTHDNKAVVYPQRLISLQKAK